MRFPATDAAKHEVARKISLSRCLFAATIRGSSATSNIYNGAAPSCSSPQSTIMTLPRTFLPCRQLLPFEPLAFTALDAQ